MEINSDKCKNKSDEIPSNVVYWQQINKQISHTLNDLKGVIILNYNSISFLDIIEFLNNFKKDHFSNILYISIVRSYGYMKNVLLQKTLDNKKISFIDLVSGYAFPTEDEIDNCIYHKPPTDLDQIKKIVNFGLEKTNPDIIVLDSLSHFIKFSNLSDVDLNSLCNFFKDLKDDANIIHDTFILLFDNSYGDILNYSEMDIDYVFKAEKIDTRLKSF